MREKQTGIHAWDGTALLRALAWGVGTEAAVVALALAVGWVETGVLQGSPDTLFLMLYMLFHLPSILAASALGLGGFGVAVIQASLMTYLLFVLYRSRKIKAMLS
jgi:hypothetical protein